jgi:predicted Zn-dependent protease with MMP-like domain
VTGWLAGWTQDEAEFELTVRRAETLARDGLAAEPGELEFMELDPLNDADFEELVRDALDELPDLLQNALQHTAVVISDGGRRVRAYGLYQSGGRHSGDPGRIVIFRDTLRRDFGFDPDKLHEEVVRVVRHELAHHVGFDELGVGELGL